MVSGEHKLPRKRQPISGFSALPFRVKSAGSVKSRSPSKQGHNYITEQNFVFETYVMTCIKYVWVLFSEDSIQMLKIICDQSAVILLGFHLQLCKLNEKESGMFDREKGSKLDPKLVTKIYPLPASLKVSFTSLTPTFPLRLKRRWHFFFWFSDTFIYRKRKLYALAWLFLNWYISFFWSALAKYLVILESPTKELVNWVETWN